MFGYEFSSVIVVKKTHNEVTGYELTSPLHVQVDFMGTVRPGYESARVWVDLKPF